MLKNEVMSKTKIVCTIGPASDNKEMLTKLVKAGMNVMRLNFSHGTHPSITKIHLITEINKELDTSVAILLDIKGRKLEQVILSMVQLNLKKVRLSQFVKKILSEQVIVLQSLIKNYIRM
ncbi:MAG: pyruvate kinase [Thomasclavelia ramosa]